MADRDCEQDMRTLIRGLEAALRWPYDGAMVRHAENPSSAYGQGYDDSYLFDMHTIHSALNVIKAVKP